LPWTNLSCNERVLIQQSGFQSCYGGATPTAQLRGMIERNAVPGGGEQQKKKGLPIAPFSIPFAGCLAIGLFGGLACLVCVVCRFRFAGIGFHLLTLGCGSACFLLLVAQMTFGFPMDRRLQQDNAKIREERAHQGVFADRDQRAAALAADALVGTCSTRRGFGARCSSPLSRSLSWLSRLLSQSLPCLRGPWL
jgi:hypothetical protein